MTDDKKNVADVLTSHRQTFEEQSKRIKRLEKTAETIEKFIKESEGGK